MHVAIPQQQAGQITCERKGHLIEHYNRPQHRWYPASPLCSSRYYVALGLGQQQQYREAARLLSCVAVWRRQLGASTAAVNSPPPLVVSLAAAHTFAVMCGSDCSWAAGACASCTTDARARLTVTVLKELFKGPTCIPGHFCGGGCRWRTGKVYMHVSVPYT